MANYFIRFFVVALLGTALSGCETAFSTGEETADSSLSISLTASKAQILSSTSDTVVITAQVVDANRNAVADQAVVFATDSGLLLAVGSKTDSNGQATATLSSAGSPTIRTITVTGQAGSARGATTVGVYGTTLQISGITSMAAGSTVLTVSAKDGGGSPVANTAIALSVTEGTVTPASGTTDASGQLQVTVNTNQSTTVTASGLGVSTTHSIAVSSDFFTVVIGSPATAYPAVNTCKPVIATWSATGGVPDGSQVNFLATRGQLHTLADCSDAGDSSASATTTGGLARVYIKSTTVGETTVQASDAGATVTAEASATFVSTLPHNINLSADKTVVAPNGTASLTAVVIDANDNLVSNARVAFSISGDSTGASISPAVAYTNTSGQAGASFVASAVSSAGQSIEVTATVYNSSLAKVASKTLNLTVGGKGLSININPADVVGVSDDRTQYYLPVSVSVVDSSGGPVVGTTVTMQAFPTYYGKGYRVWSAAAEAHIPVSTITAPDTALASYPRVLSWDGAAWEPAVGSACNNEDLRAGNPPNGTLDAAEDRNGDGNLDTGFVGNMDNTYGVTDATGTARFRFYYGKEYGHWIQMRLTASASVGGSDASKSYDFVPPVLASDVSTETKLPPGQISPFGVSPNSGDCTDPL